MKHQRLLLLALLVLAILSGRGFLSSYINEHHDSTQYLTSLVEFDLNIRAGRLLPEWAPDLAHGNGEPLFLILPPGFFAVAELFHLLGALKTTAINLTLLTSIGLSAFGMFFWVRRWGGVYGAFVASTAYVYAPYFHTDLYVRGAYSEFMVFGLAPWVFLLIDRVALGVYGRVDAVLLSVTTASIVMMHNPMALLFTPILFLYSGVIAQKERRHASWTLLVLGVGLCAFFLLPCILLKEYTHVHRLLDGYLSYANHFVYLHQMISSPWGHGILLPGAEDGMSLAFGGPFLLALIAAPLFVSSAVGGNAERRRMVRLLALICSACLFFSSAYSKFIWDRIQTLQYLQFGIRFYLPATVTAAALLGILVGHLLERRARRVALLLSTLIALAIVAIYVPHTGSPPERSFGNDAFTRERIAGSGYTAVAKDEFLPRHVVIVPPYATEGLSVVEGIATFDGVQVEPFQTAGRVSVSSPAATIRIHRIFFRGWSVKINGEERSVTHDNPYGLMEIQLPHGQFELLASFEGAPERRLGLLLSVASFAALLVYVCVRRPA